MTIEAQTPRWRRLLASVFVNRGAGGAAVTMLDDCMPVMPLVDASSVEFMQPRGEIPFSKGVVLSGGAATFGSYQMQVSPGFLLVVERVMICGFSAVQSVVTYLEATPAAPVSFADLLWARDTRVIGGGKFATVPGITPNASATGGPPVAGGGPLHTFLAAITSGPVELVTPDTGVVCGPGGVFTVMSTNVNCTFNATIAGYVRQVDPVELLAG